MVHIKETFLDGQSIKIKVDGILDESSVPLLEDLCCMHLREEKKVFVDLKSIVSICREGINLLQRMQEKVTFLNLPPFISLNRQRLSNPIAGKKS
jgi:hypothetical protein